MFYLGVDGGGTKTEFVLLDDGGRIRARTVKPASNYVQVGLEKAAGVFAAGIAEVCSLANTENRDIAYSFLGVPAFGEVERDVPVLIEMVRGILQTDRFRCGNDVEAAWAGSLACRPGISLVAGTGAIGFGKDPAGNTARAGGWGHFYGDEGSANWLGKQLISLFSKEADGREPRTPLYEIVRSHFGLQRDLDLLSILLDQVRFERDAVAKLALLVYEAAQQGDEKALALYEAAALEHSATVRAVLRRLSFPAGEDVLVSYSGGVFRAGEYILAPLRRSLAGEPIKLVRPILRPATGAALYAMELGGARPPAWLVEALQKQEAKVDTA